MLLSSDLGRRLLALSRDCPGGLVVGPEGAAPMEPAMARELLRRAAGRRSRRDPRWRAIWIGDWRRVLIENGAHAGDELDLVVITAPGQEVLPWDRSMCRHDGGPCSGKRGCRVEVEAARAWNESAPERWSQLHRAAAARVRRSLGHFEIVMRIWEPQERGVLHMNSVVAAGTARQMLAARAYRAALTELAPRYGFGFVGQKRRRMGGLHLGRYLAKYLSEGTGKLGIGDLAARDDAPRTIALVNRRLTVATGSTMRECRERRTTWNRASHLAPMSVQGCSLTEARSVGKKVRWLRRERRRGQRRDRGEAGDWNAELERRGVARESDVRWALLQCARAGLIGTIE